MSELILLHTKQHITELAPTILYQSDRKTFFSILALFSALSWTQSTFRLAES